MNKNKILIILLFIVVLALITYYIFFVSNDSLNGIVDTKDFEIQFYKIGVIEEYNSNNANASISYDNKYVYINVPNLMSPGAYAKFPITIKNVGMYTSRLESITEYGFDDNSLISIEYEGLNVANEPLEPNDEITFYVIVKWDKNALNKKDSVNIKIKLNYIQNEGGKV